jgi:hypothetical protein
MIEDLKAQLKERSVSVGKHYYRQRAYRTVINILDRLPEPATYLEQRILTAGLRNYIAKLAASHTAQAAADHAFVALFKDVKGGEIEYRVREKETHAAIYSEYAAAYKELADLLRQEGKQE